MILLLSIVIAFMFGTGAYLMLKRDLIRLIAGMVLIGNAANLFIMASTLRRGVAAILPSSKTMADPLVQALVLTAIVISFATSALAMVLVYRVYTSHYSVDLQRLAAAEEEQAEREEPASGDLQEQVEDDTDGDPSEVYATAEARP
jgi:multicomponent Na+:H+ antiporter subunit C